MSNKTLKKAIKRINKSKEEIQADMTHTAKTNHLKEVVRNMFPSLEKVDTIYDAQTTVNALSGFITALIEKKVLEIRLSDLVIDLSKEEDSKIKTAILEIIETMKDESAQELSETLERFGSTLGKLGAHKFLEKPMTEITIDDILSK